jgi:hypothetical protein
MVRRASLVVCLRLLKSAVKCDSRSANQPLHRGQWDQPRSRVSTSQHACAMFPGKDRKRVPLCIRKRTDYACLSLVGHDP